MFSTRDWQSCPGGQLEDFGAGQSHIESDVGGGRNLPQVIVPDEEEDETSPIIKAFIMCFIVVDV